MIESVWMHQISGQPDYTAFFVIRSDVGYQKKDKPIPAVAIFGVYKGSQVIIQQMDRFFKVILQLLKNAICWPFQIYLID